jgi:hypothetical protein
MTFSVTAFRITILSIITLGKIDFIETLRMTSVDISIDWHFTECHCADCHILLLIYYMSAVSIPYVIMLSVSIPYVFMLSIVVPIKFFETYELS